VFLGELVDGKSSARARCIGWSFKFETDQYMLMSIDILGEIVLCRLFLGIGNKLD
jgi:hypothetical protein